MYENVIHQDERYKVTLYMEEYDTSHANPRDMDNLGVMWCQHRRYTLGDEDFARHIPEHGAVDDFYRQMSERHSGDDLVQAMVKHIKRQLGATVVLPLYLYDHSGITISAGRDLLKGGHFQRRGHFISDPQGWDTSSVGFIFDTERTREQTGTPLDVETALQEEVKYYAMYLEGDVWGYRLEEKVQVHTKHTTTKADGTVTEQVSDHEAWEELDSCGSFLGDDAAKEEGMAALNGYLNPAA